MKLHITWKFFLYLAVLALSAVPALLHNGFLGYGPVLMVLLCGVLSFLWLCLLRRKLEFHLDAEVQNCIRGEEAIFQVSLKNNGWLPAIGVNAVFFIRDPDGLDDQSNNLRLTLSPKEARNFGFTASFPHIGLYRAGIRRIELMDVLGIFCGVRQEEQSYPLEVLPQMFRLESLLVSTSVQAESNRMTVQSLLNGSDYTGVREYALGDPIKSIHWKLSAHAGNLMTKQMESYSNTGMSVVLDLQIPTSDGASRLDEFDGIIEAGAAAGNYAAERGMDYELIFYQQNGTPVRAVPSSFRDLHGVVKEMHLMAPNHEKNVAGLIRENCQGVYSQSNIVVCTAMLTKELAELLARLKQSGKTPILLLVLSKDLDQRTRSDRMAELRRLQYGNVASRVIASAQELEG